MMSRTSFLALTLAGLVAGAPFAATGAHAASADPACARNSATPSWDVAGRLSQRENCLNNRAQAYRDGATQSAQQRVQGVQQQVQNGRDAVDGARALPGQQLNRLRDAGTAGRSQLNALGQTSRANAASMLTGGL
ncbi:hypothetical protein HLH34_15580 [Gluconacetobacter azotocaptans]|uniref:Uncharacterized protein n=1 Tax=Gluconacetobacter azotocaptans TaxID=142834 RepID=A0A7W4JV35_9PROT|nr:hypothetical protein [Gluconacetobacter azotocaptans]MBB2191360.1 hypothetical protein [Gluconacetobacter azotocaptans]MBM9402505.1 hypothetical protein [Gluconacetobacter azotocaptans]GBQ26607.1 hypothetical protein AA13594_0303 [Gluconacetobacter azotocaptans DSM 13594]